MEPLAPPISIGSRMTLTSNAPAEYIPPSFLPFSTSAIEGLSILPHCGSARIGKAERDGVAMYMCALCVEGAVQVPTLGSVLCAMPMSLDVDEDPHETVFVASPGWMQCLEQAKAIRDRYIKSRKPMFQNALENHCDNANRSKPPLCECMVDTFNEEMVSQLLSPSSAFSLPFAKKGKAARLLLTD
ncbi:hypothetical protein LPJ75_004427 [Coemansia sp. RSA 2598]|nr:hypothetical protein LPJ75_004427 [Coemansia sp. RSA 2598]